MKNLSKNIKRSNLYVMLGVLLLVNSFAHQVLGESGSTPTSQVVAKHYPGLVHSSLVDHNLIKENGHVIKPLLDFLALYNIKHQGTVPSINAAMQANFLRKP